MNRQCLFTSLLLALGLLLTACGGDQGGAPVAMEKHEAQGFTVERPKDWNVDSAESFGIAVLGVASKEFEAESFFAGGNWAMALDAAFVWIAAVPQEEADASPPSTMSSDDLSQFVFSVDDLKDYPKWMPDAEIVKEGDITIGGVKGYQLVAKGEIFPLGGQKMGAHWTVLERDAGPLLFMGFSSDRDMDKNLNIFKYMLASIKFE
jgi:hypothetical protein